MRKLILQMQVSADGFAAAGPDDEQAWVTWALEDIYKDVLHLLESSDTILIGRKLAVDYIPHRMGVLKNPDDPMYEFAKHIVAARKVIFSHTLKEAPWPDTEIESGELSAAVNRLKHESGGDLLVYGGTGFVSELIRRGLIDAYHFFINPIALGTGISPFSALTAWQPLQLRSAKATKSGLVQLIYEPA